MGRGWLVNAFVAVGAVFAGMRVASCLVYFSFGPGSVFRAGPAASISEGLASFVMALVTVVTWPVIVYRAISGGLSAAWESLFYLWYDRSAEEILFAVQGVFSVALS
jgi:hypothetical protein